MPKQWLIRPIPHTRCTQCAVRKMALFKNVPLKYLDWTQNYRQSQYLVKAKDCLYSEGESSEFVYTLYQGWVKLYKSLPNGKIQVLRFALPGDFLGLQGNMKVPMQHTAEALSDSILCAFPIKNLHKMFADRPEIAIEMISMNARVMSVCQEHLLSAGVRTAKERIAFLLLEIYYRLKLLKQFRPDGVSEISIDIPLTQADIADAVGLTKVHVNRSLRKMKAENLLCCAKGKLTIYNEKRLIELSGFDPKLIDNNPMF